MALNGNEVDNVYIIIYMYIHIIIYLYVCSWSPDGKYIAAGGEDDLITVYSFHENRVICRGRGHRSWVTAISFDPYTTLAHHGDTDYPSDDESLGELSD